MNHKTRAKFEARAKILKALAHPSRLFIMDRLSEKELCVQDLALLIDADVSTVSKHLSVLKNAGLLREEKRGTRVFHTMSVPCIMNFFSCVESVMESNLKEQASLLR